VGLAVGKFYDWRKRYGEVNQHNGKVPRDFWLLDWEKQKVLEFQLLLAGQFVFALRAALVRQQAKHPILPVIILHLIKRSTRKAEGPSGVADGIVVDTDPTHHLVLDLEQVVGIEKIVVVKQGMGDRLGFRIEVAVPAEGLTLSLLVGIG